MTSEVPAAVQGAEAVFGDAWAVIQKLRTDPLGGMAAEYTRLGENRALKTGGILAVVAALVATLGIMMGVGAVMGGFGGFGARSNSGSAFFQVLVATLVFGAVVAGVAFLARRMKHSTATFAPDLFTVGAAMLPLGISMLFAGLIGSWQLGAALTLTGFIYFILMLFTGLTSLGSVTARVAPLVIAAMMIIGTFVTQALM